MKIRLRSWKINNPDSRIERDDQIDYRNCVDSKLEKSERYSPTSTKINSVMNKRKLDTDEIYEFISDSSDKSNSKDYYLIMIACCTPFEVCQVLSSDKQVKKCKPLIHRRFNLHFIQAVSWKLSKTDLRQASDDDLKVV